MLWRSYLGEPKARLSNCGLLIITTVLALVCSSAQSSEGLPKFEPRGGDHRQYGEIRNWGNENMTNVLRLWEVGFRKHERAIHFVDYLPSGAVAMGSLYTGVADIGLEGHRAWPLEILAFHRVFGYEPLEIMVATGAYDIDGQMPGNIIFVNQRNPLSRLTLKQLDGIFGSERTGGWQGMNWSSSSARGANENIRTWGQVGLVGEWADKPIHVYGYDLTGTGFSLSMQQKVFRGGDTWNPTLMEAPLNEPGVIGPRQLPTGGVQILDAVAKDPYGIGYAGIQFGRKNSAAKSIDLASGEDAPFVEPTKENFANRTYPLIESIYVYVNRPPGAQLDPKIKEFLRYILSNEGQQDVTQDGGYLPLTAEALQQQLKKLE